MTNFWVPLAKNRKSSFNIGIKSIKKYGEKFDANIIDRERQSANILRVI